MAVKSAKRRKRSKKVCRMCGRLIPKARLKVLPDTKTCVRCASVERYSRLDIPDYAFAQHPEASRPEEDDS